MRKPYLIGLGAGLVSAVLYASVAGGNIISLILFYLAPLPVFLAGFGWGLTATAIAGIIGALLISIIIGVQPAAAYCVTLALPAILLIYLTFLHRKNDNKTGAEEPSLEWYPVGRIVLGASALAGIIASLVVILLGQDEASYIDAVTEVLNKSVFPQIQANTKTQFSPEQLKSFSQLMIRILPAATAIAWLSLTLFNMWLAMQIAKISERFSRPKPNFLAMTYPPLAGFSLVGAFILSLIGGLLGLIATGIAGALFFVFALLGMAIVHSIIPPSSWRPFMVFSLYFSVIFIGWLWPILILIALTDPYLRLRERLPSVPQPPSLRDE